MIRLTENMLDAIKQAEKIKTFTVVPTWLIELGRNRRLSITVEQGNQYIFIQEYDQKDYRNVLDQVCLFNFDYDGWLHIHQLQNIYSSITGKELQFKNKIK